MSIICNMIGETHCGRELQVEDVARTAEAHINRGGRGKNTWESLYQCKDCAAKDADTRANCHPEQHDWMLRRRAADVSTREAANALGIELVRFSHMEHLRAASSEAERDAFNRRFPQFFGDRPQAPDAKMVGVVANPKGAG